MPTFRITAPDGRTFRVEAPEGATREQALQRVQAQYTGGSSSQPGSLSDLGAAAERYRARNPAEYDQSSPEYAARYGKTSAMSVPRKFAAGAGKSVVDIGRGIKQLTGFGSAAEQDEVNAQDAELMDTGAGVAGNIAGTLATTLLPASLIGRGAQAVNLTRSARAANAFVNPTTYRAAAGAGAVQGALQPVATDESRGMNMLTGAALGVAAQGAANGIGRIAQPIRNAMSKEDAAAVSVLDKAGVPLDAVQRSGSKTAEVVKRAVDDNPFTGPGQKAFAEKQRTAFTRAVLKTIGEDADAATADVMGTAQKRIGQVFDDVAERNPIRYDEKLHSDLIRVYSQAAKELTSPDAKVINNQLADIFDKATGGMSESRDGRIIGKAYQNIKSSLDRIITDGGSKGYWAGQMKDVLEEALQRSANGDDLKALKQARTQYRRMKQIEGAIDNEGAGAISPAKLANALAVKANRAQSKYGRGDQELVILAQAGKRLLPDKFPNSGTPARIAGQLLAPTAIGLGTGYASGDPGTGVATAVGSAAALRGARGALNNQQIARMLAEGLKPGRARNLLNAPARAGVLGRQLPIVAIPALEE